MRPFRFRDGVARTWIFLAVLGGLTGAARPSPTPFVHETVDFLTRPRGRSSSLELDARGDPRIAYHNGSTFDLMYASRSGGLTWTIETVSDGFPSSSVGEFISLALDREGNPTISYYERVNGGLHVAYRSINAWVDATVDSVGDAGTFNAVALDDQGDAHVSYYDATNRELRFISRVNGGWTASVAVDTVGDVGQFTSIALDTQGFPHISYYDATNRRLKHASRQGRPDWASWTFETVDATSSVGQYSSIAVDALGNPHISYYDSTGGDLKYAVWNGSAWAIESVDTVGDVGQYTSIALDGEGDPRISYFDATLYNLKYARRTGGSWTIEPVDTQGTVGQHTSLELDGQGNPRISYFDLLNQTLKYTDSAVHLLSPLGGERWEVGSAQRVRWSGAGSVAVELSADAGLTYGTLIPSTSSHDVLVTVPPLTSEQARIRVSRSTPASVSESPGHISIAPGLISPWWSETASSTGDVGSGASLALDQGSPRISFFDATNGDLRYASWMGSGWSVQTVDSIGVVGRLTSLVLDAEGDPRIAYYLDRGVPDGDLKYAEWTGSAWSIQTLDSIRVRAIPLSIALDGQGNPSIAYWVGDGTATYARRAGTGLWTIESVSGAIGTYAHNRASLALDSEGIPHIAYEGGAGIVYASRLAGSWSFELAGSPGLQASLALDSRGTPHIAYFEAANFVLTYLTRTNTNIWVHEVADPVAAGLTRNASIAVDGRGRPSIAYLDDPNGDLKVARRVGGGWSSEALDRTGRVGVQPSLALDSEGNAHVAHYGESNGDLRYTSGAIRLMEPAVGTSWPVGAERRVAWNGTGIVDLYLSTDGGLTWQLLQSGLSGGVYRLLVPHAPTRFARIKLQRSVPSSVDITRGLFTIELFVELLELAVRRAPEPATGMVLTWRTNPGPSDLAGYRLERAEYGQDWRRIMSLTQESSFTDPEGGPNHRYRLFAVNGLGEEFLLGETTLTPPRPLAAWPLPYRGGPLRVAFTIRGKTGASREWAEVAVYNVAGRRVREIVSGRLVAGTHLVTWDGRDASGRPVAGGAYFLRARTSAGENAIKLVVLR